MDQKQNFVVTGTGHSGTGYISKLLCELGINCGHQSVFQPKTEGAKFTDYQGDASWLAAPFITELPNKIMVFHQVRDPIAVARSIIGIGFFDQIPTRDHAPYLKFIQNIKNFEHLESREERFMFHWVHWNLYVEQQASDSGCEYFRYKLEDLTPQFLRDSFLKPLGIDRSIEEIKTAQTAIGTTTNRRKRNLLINKNTLTQYPIFSQFEALAERYGYNLSNDTIKAYPIVSVIITACDRPILLKRAFNSVVSAAQKLEQSVELIIVNDGKLPLDIDGSNIENVRIKYIQTPNGPYTGVAAARNFAIENALGEYVYFLDDDDAVIENGLNMLLSKAKSEDLDLVYGSVDRIIETKSLAFIKKQHFSVKNKKIHNIKIANFIHIGSFVIKRIAIMSLFDTNLESHEDWDFLIANCEKASIGVVNDSVANIYFCKQRENRNPDSSIAAEKLEVYLIHKQIMERYPAPKLEKRRQQLLHKLKPDSKFKIKSVIDCEQLELLLLNPQETVQQSLINNHQFESFIPGLSLALLTESNKEGDVLDIGSSIGSFAIPVARGIKADSNQQRQIHCFECQKSVFLHLCSHILINQQHDIINPNHQPLSNKIEELQIPQFNPFKERFTGSVSLNKKVITTRAAMNDVAEPDTNCETYQTMETTTVDRLFADQKIALIKIDVEGMESTILKGAQKAIDQNRPFILAESWNLGEFNELREELVSLLLSLNYKLFLRENDIAAIPIEQMNDVLLKQCKTFKFSAQS